MLNLKTYLNRLYRIGKCDIIKYKLYCNAAVKIKYNIKKILLKNKKKCSVKF